MRKLQRFQIRGLFGSRNIDIPLSGNALILVGPNGIGKSSVVNIFYFFITRQWSRLIDYKFEEIILNVDDKELSAKWSDIEALSQFRKIMSSDRYAIRPVVDKLSSIGLLEEFTSIIRLSPSDRRRFSDILRFPPIEIDRIHRFINNRLGRDEADLFSRPRISLENSLSTVFDARTIYLPTYRRIEKDLREVFPDFEERYKSHISADTLTAGRSATHYIDLVSFGMEDVKKSFSNKAGEMRDFSLEKYNNLSGLYLKDVIRGTADKFTSKQINDLTDDDINSILGRVSENTLPSEDKDMLRSKVKSMQGKKKNDISTNDKFLAHYFNRLVLTNGEINEKEEDIISFVGVCNEYLNPEKIMEYDETTFKIQIKDKKGNAIDLSYLSSGEKQVISLFSHLYMEDSSGQIVVIDEPELSLSVPWQKRFLSDILASKKCDFVVAVTHSPFIYQNNLKSGAIDLRRFTEISE